MKLALILILLNYKSIIGVIYVTLEQDVTNFVQEIKLKLEKSNPIELVNTGDEDTTSLSFKSLCGSCEMYKGEFIVFIPESIQKYLFQNQSNWLNDGECEDNLYKFFRENGIQSFEHIVVGKKILNENYDDCFCDDEDFYDDEDDEN
jgi:hypothetical protein